MKTIKNLSVLLFIAFTLFALPACKKSGCIDPDATNYDVDANSSDNSCAYKGRLVFWYTQSVSDFLIDDEAYSLTFYINGQVAGSCSTSTYWTSLPNCGQNGSVTVNIDMESNKTKSYNYSVKDQTGFEYWSGSVNMQANACNSLQLTE